MVYSSKNYLENIWNKLNSNIWLAHYTDETNYSGNYNVWQICNDGKVEGISSLVDIDIMYN
jgi:GH25 family lysozyme M1 (1,4-beta-N-acetylmuramidase)